MEKEGLASIFKMEDITVMGAAELFPHLFRIWVGILCNQNCLLCADDDLRSGVFDLSLNPSRF